MRALRNMGRMGKVGWLARLSIALALAGAGLRPALADPTEVAEPADAAEAAGLAGTVDDNGVTVRIPQDTPRPQRKYSPIDRRVMLLTRELGLSATQQAQVKRVLEGQREQVARVWNDTSIPAARRVSATQAVSDRTADRIRALLTEEQRKKYIKPRQRDAAVGAAGADAESWMTAGKRR